MIKTRVKICCIGSLEEARVAVRHGAHALGLVSAMPSGPGVIPEDRIEEVARAAPPGVATFLLTSRVVASEIIAQQRRCRVNTVQICDRVTPEVHAELRSELPGISIVQVVHVAGEESVDEALEAARHADALLLDSGNPSLRVKELGGTGRTHDWTLSARIVESAAVPVFLAGGLSSANVAAAIKAVRPFGVDLCSSVRTDGRLDEDKLRRFMHAVHSAA